MTVDALVVTSLISLSDPKEVKYRTSEQSGMLTIELPRAVILGNEHYDIKIVRSIDKGNSTISVDEIAEIQKIYNAVFSAIYQKHGEKNLTPDRVALWTGAQKTDVLIGDNAAGRGSIDEKKSEDKVYESFPSDTVPLNHEDIYLLEEDNQSFGYKSFKTVHDVMLEKIVAGQKILGSAASASSSLGSVPHVTAVKSSSVIRFKGDRRYPEILKYLDGMPEDLGIKMTQFQKSKDKRAKEFREGFNQLLKDPRDTDKKATATRSLLVQWFKYLCEYWESHEIYIKQKDKYPLSLTPEEFAGFWLNRFLDGTTKNIGDRINLISFVDGINKV